MKKIILVMRKKRLGLSIMEMGLVALAMVIFAGAGVGLYNNFNENNKRAIAHQETKMLAEAASMYSVYSKTGDVPADLGALVTGLTAANSNDGVDHIPFVTKTGWTSDATTFKDPWGTAYVYSGTNRTVGCANNGGTAWEYKF